MLNLKTVTLHDAVHVVNAGTFGPVVNLNPQSSGPTKVLALFYNEGFVSITTTQGLVLVPIATVKSMRPADEKNNKA